MLTVWIGRRIEEHSGKNQFVDLAFRRTGYDEKTEVFQDFAVPENY